MIIPMKTIIQILLAIAVVTVGAIYIYLNRSQLTILKNIELYDIVLLVFFNIFFLYATGYVFKLLVGTMNINLSFIETIGLSVLTNFANYLAPARPGAALKAVYLKKTKKFAYTHFTSVFIASSFVGIFMMGASGLVLLILMYKIKPPFSFLLSVLF